MTHGIYQLNFDTLTYIGKSVNIEERYQSHLNDLKNNKHTKNIQGAYEAFGVPTLKILETVYQDPIRLSEREAYWVNNLKPQLNDAPITVAKRIESPKEKLINDQIREAFKLLRNNIDDTTICLKTGTTPKMLDSIRAGKAHIWLAQEFPINYQRMRAVQPPSKYNKLKYGYP